MPRTTPDLDQGAWKRTCNHNTGQGRTPERAKYKQSPHPQQGPPGIPPRGTGCAEKPQTEVRGLTRKLTMTPDPIGDTKPSFRSRTNEPRPRRDDPIAKVGNPSGEKDPLEQEEIEPDEGRRTGKKPRLCAHTHRYSKAAHRSHLAKQQRKPGEDRVLASTETSQVKAWSPATRRHDKPTEDVGKQRHNP